MQNNICKYYFFKEIIVKNPVIFPAKIKSLKYAHELAVNCSQTCGTFMGGGG